MKLVACISYYNNADYLRATLESVKHYVDEIILIDGRYDTYPARERCDFSTDGSEWIAYSFKQDNELPVHHFGIDGEVWKNQVEKRNAYLDLVDVGDWLMMIDADEILYCNVQNIDSVDKHPLTKEEFKQAILDHADEHNRVAVEITGYSNRFRIFKKQEGMHYQDYHYKIVAPGYKGNFIDIYDAALPKPLSVAKYIHMKWQRDPQVYEDKKEFYKNRAPLEAFRATMDMKEKFKDMEPEQLVKYVNKLKPDEIKGIATAVNK